MGRARNLARHRWGRNPAPLTPFELACLDHLNRGRAASNRDRVTEAGAASPPPYNPRMDLFDSARAAHRRDARPLAARMRPRTLDEYVGQTHFLAPGKLLRRMLQADRLGSLIFTGPPGCGKTALAHVIALSTKSDFKPLNAVSATTKDVREVLAAARERLEDHGTRTILFLDEIHRFNKAQQDTLLPDVEEGVVTLIGATTQNPFFSIVTPLLSRSQIFRFEPLSEADIATVVRRALADPERRRWRSGRPPPTATRAGRSRHSRSR